MKCKSIGLLFGLLAILPVAGAAVPPDRGMVVLYLVRHAETVPPPYKENPPNPPLSETGRARAAQLAHLLAAEGISRVFSTEYRRTRETAKPLAKQFGLAVEPYDPGKLEDFALELRSRPGRHVIVGHSNTTPQLVELLGGDPGEPIGVKREFDRLYILTLDGAGKVATMHLRYGESPAKE